VIQVVVEEKLGHVWLILVRHLSRFGHEKGNKHVLWNLKFGTRVREIDVSNCSRQKASVFLRVVKGALKPFETFLLLTG
jgi:hypothetical protein